MKYEARISVVRAYKYTGRAAEAPEWIDRNWIGYITPKGVEGEKSGPVLYVVDNNGMSIGTCFVGDYVVRQNILVDDEKALGGKRIEYDRMGVMDAKEFERLYRAYMPHEDAEGPQ